MQFRYSPDAKGTPMGDAERILQDPQMPFVLSGDNTEGMRQENARLKALLVQLSTIIAKNVAAQK